MIDKLSGFQKKGQQFLDNTLFRQGFSESIILFLFGIYMIYYYLNTTMFAIQWPDNFLPYLQILLVVAVIFRCIMSNFIDKKSISIILVVMPIFLIAYQTVPFSELITNVFLLVALCGINYKQVLKIYLCVSIPITIYTIIASKMGWVTNLIYHQGERVRESFGFIYPTDFAAHISFIIMVWILLRQLKCTYIEVGAMLLCGIFLHIYCDVRCSEIVILLLVCMVVCLKIIYAKKKKKIQLPFFLKIGCLLSPIVFSGIMILLCRFYNPNNSVMIFLNKLLSGRLFLGKRTFDDYNTTLWGQYIEMIGNGRSTVVPEYYSFIDCSYLNILMRFGLFVFIAVLFLIEIIMLKNINNTFVLIAITIVCLASMIEHHLFEFHYNIFIILPLASFKNDISLGIKRKNTL